MNVELVKIAMDEYDARITFAAACPYEPAKAQLCADAGRWLREALEEAKNR